MKAFPIKGWNGYEETIHEGMDLRDYFAAKAMQAYINELDTEDIFPRIAELSYSMADAMMKAREQ